jgi:integrase
VAKHRNRRVPTLLFTKLRGIGWHVNYRDAKSGLPRKHRFNVAEKEREAEARVLYLAWVLEHMGGDAPERFAKQAAPKQRTPKKSELLSGCLLEISSGLLESDLARVRKPDEPKRRGSIAAPVYRDRKKHMRDFLDFLNTRHGPGSVKRMRLADLSMEDVEAFNREIVTKGFSASQVAKRLQQIKSLIDRAGRPEHGKQMLKWNWDSRDVAHGTPTHERRFPTVDQLRKMLRGTDLRGKTMFWLGVGLGLGARDLSVIRVGQISQDAYDLRRAKTGVERFGQTPPIVWAYVSKYQAAEKRPSGQLLFVTRTGVPLVHPKGNAVTQWWDKLRTRVGESKETIPGFYTLRHLGATEFGSRPGTSISDVKRWLGHSASSDMADVYMRPVRPEYREIVAWARRLLQSSRPLPRGTSSQPPTLQTRK